MEKKPKPTTEKLIKSVSRQPQLVWDKLSLEQKKNTQDFGEFYISFLNSSKTERATVKNIESLALKEGFKNISKATKETKKVIFNFKEKWIVLALLGKESLKLGFKLIASHTDSPRLDLKMNPLYEDVSLALFKTHYYGGIKKYQWVSRPLALCGRIILKSGKVIDIELGLNPTDPVFTIPDLLPHLAHKIQADKKISEAILGEKLNPIVGSLPFPDEAAKDRFKLNIMSILHKKYALTEEDFCFAELELVPADPVRESGFDSNLIAGYGHDDRSCVYTSLRALLDSKPGLKTCLALFVDKEEIGSEGNTSAQSHFLEIVISRILKLTDEKDSSASDEALSNAKAISADVTAAIHPDYQEVHEERNAAKMGFGINLTKYTGAGGKYMASDASAEYLNEIRKIFEENKIVWQISELGKVDEGGGGTVAKFLANYGMDIIDAGPALLGMHSPFELIHKADLYMTYLAYKAFYKS